MKQAVWILFFITAWATVAMAAPTMQYYSNLDTDSTIALDHDTVAGIELWSNPSTGYGWRAKSPLGKHIRIVGSKYEASEPGMPGTWGVTTIYVVGADPGETELVLEYRRAYSEAVADTIRYRFRTAATFTEVFSVPSPAEPPPMADSQSDVDTTLGLPTAFNWCDKNGCTPIKDQGNCGSCWAFATVAPLESLIKLNDGAAVDLSEQYLLSCNDEGWGCDGGFWAHDYHQWKTVSSQSEAGAVLERNVPYKGRDTSCGPDHEKSHKIASWEYVCGSSKCTPSIAQIKQAIYKHGPVTVAVCADTAMQNYRGGVFSGPGCTELNHGVVLVGWNDDDGGYWIMRNSWGTIWGESGYMRIGYGVSGIGAYANYVEYGDAPNPDPEPEPEPEPSDQCVTADNLDHLAQDRAYRCGFLKWEACAFGSGDNLGWALTFFSEITSVQETADDNWQRVASCPK